MSLPSKPPLTGPGQAKGILGDQLARHISKDYGQSSVAAEPAAKMPTEPTGGMVIRGRFKLMSSSKYVVQLHYTVEGGQRSLTVGHDSTIARVPAGPLDVDDFSALMVALADPEMKEAQRSVLFEHLAFSAKAFSPRVLGMLVEHIERRPSQYPADTLEGVAAALEQYDPKAARLLRSILAIKS
jgi:hypothetical protein